MCGLKASDVREELVSAAAREAEQDFVYGEIKPAASRGFFATSARELGLLAGTEAPAGYLVRVMHSRVSGLVPCACRPHPVLTSYLRGGQRHTPTPHIHT